MRVRTGYSFKTAVGHVPEVLSRLSEIGAEAAPISDRNSTFGFVPWTKAAEEMGLRPVYGVELAVVPEIKEKKAVVDFWTFFAAEDVRAINELVWRATTRKTPMLTYDEALEAKGVFKITGERVLLDLIEPGDAFVSLSPSSRGIYKEAKRRGFEFVATSDNYYTRETDKEFYRIAISFASTQTYPQHVLSDDEWDAACSWASPEDRGKAIENRDKITVDCRAELKRATLLAPDRPKTLRELCEDGATRVGVDLSEDVYAKRLDRELELIKEKDFEDYFFIIADLMQEARKLMVVGPARGSSCGSLVCYLLGITAIDPIPHDLVFERFIDTTRKDLPDIDLDFSDVHRDLLFDYMKDKYGRERVARLGSVNMFKAKSALKAIGYPLRIPDWKLNEVSNVIIKRSFGDSRASSTVIDTLKDTDVGRNLLEEFPSAEIAGRLEGHPTAAGQHAAGMVLTQEPVMNFVAIDARNGTTMCNKYDAEALNLLKIDMLGLTQLSIFERVLELIGEEQTSDFLEAIPMEQQEAFGVLNSMHFSGIFQFTPESASAGLVKSVVQEYGGGLEKLEDIVALTALVRPGPLGSGAAEKWIRRRTGHEDVQVIDPALEPFMRKTLGIIIYQEQVLQIGREIGGLSWEEVTALRKAMSKSLGKEYFDQFGNKFKENANKNTSMSTRELDEFWDDLCTYGMWAFNRSHSVAYGVVSYWCCWLKAHYPVEFAAATLDAHNSIDRQIVTLREMREEGIDYVSIDPDRSTDKWEIAERDGKRVLVGPLSNIFGVGPKMVDKIMQARRGETELTPSIKKKLARAETEIDSLTPIADAVEGLYPDGLDKVGIITEPTPISEVHPGGRRGSVVIVGKVTKVAPLDENEPTRVAKRGGKKVAGPTDALNLWLADDTDTIFCKINRYDFRRIGRRTLEQARVGKSLFAIKGDVPEDFRMLWVKQIKYLGEV